MAFGVDHGTSLISVDREYIDDRMASRVYDLESIRSSADYDWLTVESTPKTFLSGFESMTLEEASRVRS